MSENMQFPIPNSVLEPYIKQAVSAAITASLGDGAKLVELAVHQAMQAKVRADGLRSNSDYENKYPLVEAVAQNRIQEITRQVINEMAEGMRPQIKAAIESQLKKKHSVIAQALVEGLIQSLATSWSVKVDITAPRGS
jgi:RecG-like helicase